MLNTYFIIKYHVFHEQISSLIYWDKIYPNKENYIIQILL